MSGFSLNLPTFKEIENSLQRTWDLIEESEKLSQKHLMSARLVCNRCHLCLPDCCKKLPSYSRPLFYSNYEFEPNPAIKDLHYQNLALAEENLQLSRRIREMSQKTPELRKSRESLSKNSAWNVTQRIFDLEDKVDHVEKELARSSLRSEVSTSADEGFLQLSRRMDQTQSGFKRLYKKIDEVERILSEPKDRHCARCLPSK